MHKSHVSTHDRGIGKLASSIRTGESHLVSSEDDEVQIFGLDTLANNNLGKEITSYYFEYEMLIQNPEIDAITLLANFEQARILCAVRDGELGIESLNTEIERYLESRNLKQI